MRSRAMIAVLRACLAARWRARRLRDRRAIAAYQRRRLRSLTRQATAQLPFYRPYAGKNFEALPVKGALLANFQAMNRAGLKRDDVREALEHGRERLAGRIIGRSTGTSGNRGYYVIGEEERFVWLGTILSKTLPDALWRGHRVALAMPALSDLYSSATADSRITLEFFDLAQGPEAWADRLVRFAPDTIVAPPKVLRWLAERGLLTASHIFSGAEVLDDLDRSGQCSNLSTRLPPRLHSRRRVRNTCYRAAASSSFQRSVSPAWNGTTRVSPSPSVAGTGLSVRMRVTLASFTGRP